MRPITMVDATSVRVLLRERWAVLSPSPSLSLTCSTWVVLDTEASSVPPTASDASGISVAEAASPISPSRMAESTAGSTRVFSGSVLGPRKKGVRRD